MDIFKNGDSMNSAYHSMESGPLPLVCSKYIITKKFVPYSYALLAFDLLHIFGIWFAFYFETIYIKNNK